MNHGCDTRIDAQGHGALRDRRRRLLSGRVPVTTDTHRLGISIVNTDNIEDTHHNNLGTDTAT